MVEESETGIEKDAKIFKVGRVGDAVGAKRRRKIIGRTESGKKDRFGLGGVDGDAVRKELVAKGGETSAEAVADNLLGGGRG